MSSILYVQPEILKTFAENAEADDQMVWQTLAAATSRLFDRAAEVADGFFAVQQGAAIEKTFISNGTKYVRLSPYLPGTIELVQWSGSNSETEINESDYYEKDGFLIFGDYYFTRLYLDPLSKIKVTAKFGFAAIPADVTQAVIEQALMLWRRKRNTMRF